MKLDKLGIWVICQSISSVVRNFWYLLDISLKVAPLWFYSTLEWTNNTVKYLVLHRSDDLLTLISNRGFNVMSKFHWFLTWIWMNEFYFDLTFLGESCCRVRRTQESCGSAESVCMLMLWKHNSAMCTKTGRVAALPHWISVLRGDWSAVVLNSAWVRQAGAETLFWQQMMWCETAFNDTRHSLA